MPPNTPLTHPRISYEATHRGRGPSRPSWDALRWEERPGTDQTEAQPDVRPDIRPISLGSYWTQAGAKLACRTDAAMRGEACELTVTT